VAIRGKIDDSVPDFLTNKFSQMEVTAADQLDDFMPQK
jgi:hypothetical protein